MKQILCKTSTSSSLPQAHFPATLWNPGSRGKMRCGLPCTHHRLQPISFEAGTACQIRSNLSPLRSNQFLHHAALHRLRASDISYESSLTPPLQIKNTQPHTPDLCIKCLQTGDNNQDKKRPLIFLFFLKSPAKRDLTWLTAPLVSMFPKRYWNPNECDTEQTASDLWLGGKPKSSLPGASAAAPGRNGQTNKICLGFLL